MGVDDPHDNPSILIDDQGYIWVFVSGRVGFVWDSNTKAKNLLVLTDLKNNNPRNDLSTTKKMGSTFFNFFTKYTGVRQLYIEKSENGIQWSDNELLAAMPEQKNEKSGHYQISAQYQEKNRNFFLTATPMAL